MIDFDLQGTFGRCPSPISFVLIYALVVDKLSDTRFFLGAQIGFSGVKITPENCGTKYPFHCFTYNSGIFHNETNLNNFHIMRDTTCAILNFVEKCLWGWTTPKLFLLHTKLPNSRKFRRKNLETIYVIHDNQIKFTCFCIFT